MGISVELKPFHLRVISSLLVNLAAGLILLTFTSRDIIVLIMTGSLAILFIMLSMRIEKILEDL